jgi:hypothetical protein
VERLLGPLPTIQPLSYSKEVFVNGEWVRNPQGSPALGWTWSLGQDPPRRWDANLQQFFHRCWVAVSSKCDDILDGYAALAKCIRIIGVKSKDPMHLATSPRPYSLTLKRSRWFRIPFDGGAFGHITRSRSHVSLSLPRRGHSGPALLRRCPGPGREG